MNTTMFSIAHPIRVVSRAELRSKGKVYKSGQTINPESSDTFCRGNLMTALAGVWKRKREDLKKKRAPLFKRYEKSPNDLRLAREIKMIDDQIAECTQQMELENVKGAASLGSVPMTARRRTHLAFPSAESW